MSVKNVTPLDRHVGARIRMRRQMLGMSQEKLGAAVGVTFQQIQKYERGINRIGASRLQKIGETLNVPISYMYNGASDREDDPQRAESGVVPAELAASREAIRLLQAFNAITSIIAKKALLEVAQALAYGDPVVAVSRIDPAKGILAEH